MSAWGWQKRSGLPHPPLIGRFIPKRLRNRFGSGMEEVRHTMEKNGLQTKAKCDRHVGVIPFTRPDNRCGDSVGCGWPTDFVVLRTATDFYDSLATVVFFGLRPSQLPVIGEHRCWLGVSAEGSGDLQVFFRGSVDFARCKRRYLPVAKMSCMRGSTLATLLEAQIHTPTVLSLWRHLPLGAHLMSWR